MRLLTPLHELAGGGDSCGAQQLLELGELLLASIRQRRDQIRTLAGAPTRGFGAVAGVLRAAVVALLHLTDGSRDATRLTVLAAAPPPPPGDRPEGPASSGSGRP